jgi:DNA polymerase-1
MSATPLLLVDGSNLLFRSWFGFPARIKSRDKARDLTGVFGFFALLRVAVRKETAAAPEIMVVFDGELGSEERREADPAYKDTAPPTKQPWPRSRRFPTSSAASAPWASAGPR